MCDVKCFFCHRDDIGALSKEHLFSVPVCDGFGIDRTTDMARLDGNAGRVRSMAPLTQTSVSLPCRGCNSGWMNDLELAMRDEVAPWVRDGAVELGASALSVLLRWALKTHIVLSAMEGNIRRFGRKDWKKGPLVMPQPGRALRLASGDFDGALAGVVVALNRATEPGFTAFGNPTVVPQGPDHIGPASVSVSGVQLGRLEVWAIVPVFPSAKVKLPASLAPATPSCVFNALPAGTRMQATLPRIVVDHGHHSFSAITAAVQELMRHQPE